MKVISSFIPAPLAFYKKVISQGGADVMVMILDFGTRYNGVAELGLDSIATGGGLHCDGISALDWDVYPAKLMSEEIRDIYYTRKMSGLIYGYPYIKPSLLAGKPFQGRVISRQVLELHSYGCFDGIPLTRFNEAGTTERAKVMLGFGQRSVPDLTDEEKIALDMKSATLIGTDFFNFLRNKNV